MKNEETENIHKLKIIANAEICLKIFTYISFWANNMQIININHKIEETNDNLDFIHYFVILIKADQACFRNLKNYLEE
jgi:hypothetical protein